MAHASLGAAADLERAIARLRQEWPDVRILVRADSGFAVPAFYLARERLRTEYTVDVAMNAVAARRMSENRVSPISDTPSSPAFPAASGGGVWRGRRGGRI
jgi:hypothetical protein